MFPGMLSAKRSAPTWAPFLGYPPGIHKVPLTRCTPPHVSAPRRDETHTDSKGGKGIHAIPHRWLDPHSLARRRGVRAGIGIALYLFQGGQDGQEHLVPAPRRRRRRISQGSHSAMAAPTAQYPPLLLDIREHSSAGLGLSFMAFTAKRTRSTVVITTKIGQTRDRRRASPALTNHTRPSRAPCCHDFTAHTSLSPCRHHPPPPGDSRRNFASISMFSPPRHRKQWGAKGTNLQVTCTPCNVERDRGGVLGAHQTWEA